MSPISPDPKAMQEVNEYAAQYRKEHPVEYMILPRDLKDFLTEHPDLYQLDSNGKGGDAKITIDQKNIPPQFEDYIKQHPEIFSVTHFGDTSSSDMEKPYGMR